MDNYDPDRAWGVLEDAIKKIQSSQRGGLSFEELYRNVYNMVLRRHSERLYNGLVSCMDAHCGAIAATVRDTQDEQLLDELKRNWEHYRKSTQLIRDVFQYMDKRFTSDPRQQRSPVHPLGMQRWLQNVVRNDVIKERLRNVMLEEIHKERTGVMIDRSLMKSTTQMLTTLGPDVYRDDFEAPLIAASTEFYKAEAQQYLSSCSCGEYLTKTENRLHEEEQRTDKYLDSSTKEKLTNVVDAELIKKQMKALVEMEHSGLVSMLCDDKHDDVARMYTLLKRVDGGLTLVMEMLTAHVLEVGTAVVKDPELAAKPLDFVQRLLDLRDKYGAFLDKSFQNDVQVKACLDQAFTDVINNNSQSPEYISLFIDEKLRNAKGLTDAEVDLVLDKVMVLFSCLQQKDLFETYYRKHLAKRLLGGRAVSDDLERSMLLKLKSACGYQFTSKSESMFQDIRTSRDTMQKFKNTSQNSSGLEVSVQVLTTGSWPIDAKLQPCQLPAAALDCCSRFETFYNNEHNGRKLKWQTNMGTADVKAQFNKKSHELNVSTYQMCILMLFNEQERLTYREIADATEIPPADLKRALQSMACVKGKNILKKEPMGRDVNDSDAFCVNADFAGERYKLKISTVAAQRESDSEKKATRMKVEEDRKPYVEAAIVRIMKARKRLDYNSIVVEVTTQLRSQFQPDPTFIKKRIEGLIDRDFIKRAEDDRRVYEYVA